MKRVKNNELQREWSYQKVFNLKAFLTVMVQELDAYNHISLNSPAFNSLIFQLLLCIVFKEAKFRMNPFFFMFNMHLISWNNQSSVSTDLFKKGLGLC